MQKLKRKGLRNFHNVFNFAHAQVHRIMMKVNPSPTGKFKVIFTAFEYCQKCLF